MDIVKAIVNCLTGHEDVSSSNSEGLSGNEKSWSLEKEERLAADIIEILFTSEKHGQNLKYQLDEVVHTEGWYEKLARHILDQLVSALNSGKGMGQAMKKAFDKAYKMANDFVHKHPVYAAAIVTVIAIGILVLLMLWVVELLGFGELGPVKGSFAAWWQSTFPNAEARSFFSYLQRLGMKWGVK